MAADDEQHGDGQHGVDAAQRVDERPDAAVPDEPTAETEPSASPPPSPFGVPGTPLGRTGPFYVGFVGGIGVLTAIWLAGAITQARQVIVLLVVSMFLAVGLNPMVERLIRAGLRRSLAVLATALVAVIVFAGFGAAIVPPLADQTTQFVDDLPNLLTQLTEHPTIQDLDERYDVIQRIQDALTAGLTIDVFGGFVGVGKVVLGTAFATLTVLILTLYFLSALPRIKEYAYALVPRTRRERVRLLGDEILRRVGGYVSGAIMVAFLAGSVSFFFLLIIGLDFALTLALVVAVLALIPMIGASLGAVVVTVVALTDSAQKAIACIIFFVIYQQFENYVVYPRVMKRSVDVPAALTVVAALIGGTLLGIVGALLAIPTAAAILLLVREVVIPRQEAS